MVLFIQRIVRRASSQLWVVLGFAAMLGVDVVLLVRSSGLLSGTCGEGCDQVLGSSFGTVMGIPVAALGLIMHVALGFAYVGRRKVGGVAPLAALVGAVVGAALWFGYVQAFVLRAWCPWCCAAHVVGLVFVVCVRVWIGRWIWALAGCVGCVFAFASLPSGRSSSLATGTGESVFSISTDHFSFHVGRYRLPLGDLPQSGSMTSGKVLAALTDYTCPHCRRVHGALLGLLEGSPGQLGVAWLPAYRNEVGGRIQGYMLALHRTDRGLYESLDAALWSGELAPEPELVLHEIKRRLPDWAGTWQGHLPWAEKVLATVREVVLANRDLVNTTDLPQVMLNDRVIVGDGGETGKLAELLRSRLGLTELIKPTLELAHSQIDVGTVIVGQDVMAMVRFRNSGKAILRIEGFQDARSARVALGAEGSWRPGDSGEVQIVVPVPKRPGEFRTQIQLLTNAEKSLVMVKGNAVEPSWQFSATTFEFGVWRAGAPPPQAITVQLSFTQPQTVGVPFVTSPGFVGTTTVVEAQRAFDLTLTPTSALAIGNHRLVVTIPVRQGVDLATGDLLPQPAGLPTSLAVDLTIVRE
jgi:uncharacterized membrane protein